MLAFALNRYLVSSGLDSDLWIGADCTPLTSCLESPVNARIAGMEGLNAPRIISRVSGLADTYTIVNQQRANKAPSKERTAEHRESRIETNEHSTSDEGRGNLDKPAPVIDILGPVFVAAPDEEPKKWLDFAVE